jgi:PAS domain S-box-containing protein
MFAAMNVIRHELTTLADQASFEGSGSGSPVAALHKILDIELAIMLESYAEASLARAQAAERERRVDAEQKLELSEARYAEVVEKAEALITTSDLAGRILLFNATAARVTGLDKRSAPGRKWLDVFVPDSDRARVRALYAEALRGQPASYEGPVQTKRGSGEEQRRVRWHFTTLPGRAEPALCAIGIDVTNEHALAVRTRRAERLAGLGTMAAGLAHEIRNPLNAASLQLNVARRKLAREKLADSIGVAVEVAEREMQRLAGLVEDFLQFARPHPLRLAVIDLRELSASIVALLTPEAAEKHAQLALRSTIAVRLELDQERIRQVLLNLVRNAIEAVSAHGHVTISVEAIGDTAQLEVRDDGPGFASDAPIFEPFFTTKSNGTGLGLAIAHRIVMDHGGSIGAESRPGHTVFRLSLPIVRAANA